MKKKTPLAVALTITASDDPLQAAFVSILEKRSRGKALDRLSAQEQVIFLVRELENAVCDGGFASYYYDYGAEHANEVADAFLAIGAPQVADLCRKANSVFGEKVPSNWDERWNQYNRLTQDNAFGRMWEECDNAFYASLDDLRELELAYVRANAASFGQ